MSQIPQQLWVYRARLVHIVDGDTCDVYLDAGLNNYRTERLRLLGLNCPEVHGPSKAAGDAATAFTRDWLAAGTSTDGWPLIVVTHKSDVFGRYLATVFRVVDGRELNQDLLDAGHAVAFMVGRD